LCGYSTATCTFVVRPPRQRPRALVARFADRQLGLRLGTLPGAGGVLVRAVYPDQ
jgi:hypothetical protein